MKIAFLKRKMRLSKSMLNKIKIKSLVKGKINFGSKVPLRMWSSYWPIPKTLKIEKYTTKIRAHGRLIEIKRYRLLGKMQKVQTKIKKRWYRGNATYGLDYVIKNRYVWVVIKSNLPQKISTNRENLISDGKWLFYKIPEGQISIWYSYGMGRISFAIVPKAINLNESFWETMGILVGEMQKRGAIKISNVEPLIIRTIIKWFDSSNIFKKEFWTFTISINSKTIGKSEKVAAENNARDFWSKEIGINKNKIGSVYWYDQFNSEIVPNYGELNISFSCGVIRKLIDLLIKFSKTNSVKQIDFAIPFIRGIFAAEGEINLNGNRVAQIGIASKFFEERKLYEKVIRRIGIKAKASTKTHHTVITGLPNFLKCCEIDISKLHTERKRKLVKYLTNMNTIKALKLMRHDKISVPEIVKIMNLKDYRNMNKNLSSLYKNGFLERSKKTKYYSYKLSKLTNDIIRTLD